MENKNRYIRSVGRAIAASVASIVIYLIATLALQISYLSDSPMLVALEPFAVCIFCTALFPFIFNSFSLAFAYSDRCAIEEFLEREDEEVSFFGEIKLFFKSPAYLIELAATAALVLLTAFLGGFISFYGMFPENIHVDPWLAPLVLTPLACMLLIISKYEASRYFLKLKRENGIDKLLAPSWIVKRLLLIVFLYPLTAPFVPLPVFAIYTVFGVIVELTALLTTLGFLLGITALFLFAWLLKVLFGIRKRKKFIKRLSEIAEKEAYTLSSVKTPFRSFFTSKNHCSFSLSRGDEQYECIMLSTLWKRAPLVFTSPTDAQIHHIIGTEKRNFTLRHNMEFYHIGAGERIVIVDPVPKAVFVSEEHKKRRISCTDTVWNITVHDAESFLGCMERHCLKRKNTRINND